MNSDPRHFNLKHNSQKMDLFSAPLLKEKPGMPFKSASHASNFRASARQHQTTPRNTPLPKILSVNPSTHLQLNFAKSVRSSVSEAPSGSMSFTPQDTGHSFIQRTWSTFSNMTDSERNQLLKGILGRCSSKQIETICTCLNLRTIDTSLTGYQVVKKNCNANQLDKF